MSRPSGSMPKKISPLILLLIIIGIGFLLKDRIFGPQTLNVGQVPAVGPGEYLFCSWNVENLFDDQNDKRRNPDEEYDTWFSSRTEDLQLKLKHLSETLLKMNGGRGPDIIALMEVETVRAAELLRDALNKSLPEGAAPYGPVQMKEVSAGRHIAPAILARVPVKNAKGFNQSRILEVHLEANGQELIVLASHWTSQRTDTGDAGKRDRYADTIYDACASQFRSNPAADILVCGDFNDEPTAKSVVEHLHADGDAAKVSASRDRLLFLNLFAGKDPQKYGTLYYKTPLIYDHICVSPGLLDNAGWSCDPASAQTFTDGLIRPGSTRRQPWRFGNRNDDKNRGYSDHFPVTVKLKVQ